MKSPNNKKENQFSEENFKTKNSDNKKKNKKQKKNKAFLGEIENSTSKPNAINRYNNLSTKGNFNNALLKTVVDVVAGTIFAPAISASFGKYAPIAGVGLTLGGHYSGDESGLMRSIGVATLAHNVAESDGYRQADSTFKSRLENLTDKLLGFFFMKSSPSSTATLPSDLTQIVNGYSDEFTLEKNTDSINNSNLDLGELDAIEDHLEFEAMKFEQEKESEDLAKDQRPKDAFDIELEEWNKWKNSNFNENEQSNNRNRSDNWLDDDIDFSKM